MPHRLTIIGLGPGDPGLRTISMLAALAGARRILLRTGVHPGLEDLLADERVSTCDDLYRFADSFDDVYLTIVDRVITLLEEDDLVFAVPGSPTSGEQTVRALRKAVAAAGHTLEIMPTVSGLDLVAAVADLDLIADQIQILDALAIRSWLDSAPFNGSALDISPARPLIITQVFSPDVASAVKIALLGLYPPDHRIGIVDWANLTAQPVLAEIELGLLDRMPVDHLTSVVVTPLDWRARTRSFHELLRILARLRDEQGCPWDREQSHSTLRGAVIEEAFEVVDAIDRSDIANLVDELGDLLLQVAMHAQIGAEAGEFEISDVLDAVTSKIIRRHPHVFSDVVANTPDDVIATWKSVKESESIASAKSDHPLLSLPASMPASLKIALLEVEDGSELTDAEAQELACRVAHDIRTLVRSGRTPDQLIDSAYRILEP